MEKRIPLATPTMHGKELDFIQEAFDKNWIAPLGFNCDSFENEMSNYLSEGKENCYALSLNSGTSALHMAVKLAGVKKGDVVFYVVVNNFKGIRKNVVNNVFVFFKSALLGNLKNIQMQRLLCLLICTERP
ncbi:MAG: DegT/DnrJ/EryC1/StrS family aminotransferase, partial [Clostridia bacterium]|nr:DegT/DnrJ/EryC1/StrS family aminotransferase [Clostridia bacterium]